MSIVRTYTEYEIPKDIKDRIPEYFYLAMAGELFGVFGKTQFEKIVLSDDPEDVEDGYYDLNSSTSGWVEAFKMTCKKLDMMWLVEYWKTLEWYDSDLFDGEIEAEIIERVCENKILEGGSNTYYQHLLDAFEV